MFPDLLFTTRNKIVITSILIFITGVCVFLFNKRLAVLPNKSNHLTGPTRYIPSSQENKGRTNPSIGYDKESVKKILYKQKNKIALSAADKEVEQRILAVTEGGSGVIHVSPYYKITYISSGDNYLVRITTTDINKAKQDAVNWFTDQGFSKDMICNKPVSFYPDWDTAQQLKKANVRFGGLADGC